MPHPSSLDTDRAGTGVRGLHDVLGGGLPRDRLYLIDGEPGTGKTTLALQFLLEGAARGERGLYVTLSETAEELRASAESHGWSLDGVEIYQLEAAEGGCAIAGTALAFRGCEQLAGAAVIEDDPERLADRALTLLADEDARAHSASELRNRVSTYYSRQTTLTQMAHLAGVQ